MIVISPFARRNYVDHNLSDQASIINFIEYNWSLPGISGSADLLLSSVDRHEGVPFDLAGMFDFDHSGHHSQLLLDPVTGQPVHGHGHGHQRAEHSRRHRVR